MLQVARDYTEHCRAWVEDGVPFTDEADRAMILVEQHCVKLAWEATDLLFTSAGTSSGRTRFEIGARISAIWRCCAPMAPCATCERRLTRARLHFGHAAAGSAVTVEERRRAYRPRRHGHADGGPSRQGGSHADRVRSQRRRRAHRSRRPYNNVAVARSPREVGAASDIVLTMLPSGKEVRAVALERRRVAARAQARRPAARYLVVRTVVHQGRRGAARRGRHRDGRRAGFGRRGRRQGGRSRLHDRRRAGGRGPRQDRFWRVLGKQHFHLGPVGSGHVMKSINNLVTAVTLLATTEGLLAGTRLGLDPTVDERRARRLDRRVLGRQHPVPPPHLQPPL